MDFRKGFTLIEVILVIGLLLIIATFGLFFSFESFRGYSFHSDRDILVSLLQHVRSQAIGNTCRGSGCTDGKSQGIKIQNDKFIMFQGNSFDDLSTDHSLDVIVSTNSNVSHSGQDEFVFTQLSGDVLDPGDVTLTDLSGKTSTISINSEGQVIWTN